MGRAGVGAAHLSFPILVIGSSCHSTGPFPLWGWRCVVSYLFRPLGARRRRFLRMGLGAMQQRCAHMDYYSIILGAREGRILGLAVFCIITLTYQGSRVRSLCRLAVVVLYFCRECVLLVLWDVAIHQYLLSDATMVVINQFVITNLMHICYIS
jgi:hypothetical protein